MSTDKGLFFLLYTLIFKQYCRENYWYNVLAHWAFWQINISNMDLMTEVKEGILKQVEHSVLKVNKLISL